MQIRGRLLGILAVALLALSSVTGGLAQDATPEAMEPAASPVAASDCGTLMGLGTPDDGCLIFINGIVDSGELDLYVDGLKAVEGLSFDDVSGYFSLPAGSYSFDLVPSAEPIENAIFSVADSNISAGTAYELAAIGTRDAPQLLASPVDLSPLPPGTDGTPLRNTRIRAIQAVPDAPTLHLSLIGGDIADRTFPNLTFPQVSDYVDKTAGMYRLLLSAEDGVLASVDLNDVDFQGDTVYSLYAIGNAANDDLRLLNVAVDLTDGTSTARAIPPALVSEVVEVSRFALYEGGCLRLSGQVAFELSGSGYNGAGPGTLAPWGIGDDATGALGAVPVQYGEGVLDDLNLGDLLGGRTVSVVVHDAATGGVVACGEVGGVVEEADRFWQHDRLIVGLQPVGESGISGTATFTEDTGILSDKINVAVSLVAPGDWAAFPGA
jgi:hypothetical protein